MKNFFLIAFLCIATFALKAQTQTITYTPMTAAGYQYKYTEHDSGFNLPNRDTTTGRGTRRGGSMVFNPANKTFYGWDGVKWSVLGSGSSSTSGTFVDSITVSGNNICQWIAGVPKCYLLNTGGQTFIGIDSVTYSGNSICQWKNGIPTCYSVIPGVDSVVITGNQLCQWKAGVPICYTINGNVLGTGIDSVTVVGNTLCQYSGGVPTCYTINNTSHGIDSLTVNDSLLCSWSAGVSTCFVIGHEDTVFLADDLVNRPRTASGKQVIGRLHSDGYTGGRVSSAGCMTLDVTPIDYYIGGKHYAAPETQVTIGASDPTLFRTDGIIADTSGNVSVLPGTASSTPGIVPQINPRSQILLTTVIIAPGSTCLSIDSKFIYSEGVIPTNWDTSHSGTINIQFRNTVNAHSGTHAIFIQTYTDLSSYSFLDSGPDTVSTGEVLKGWVYFNIPVGTPTGNTGELNSDPGPIPVPNNLYVQLFQDAVAISDKISLNAYLTPSLTGVYQDLNVPFSDFRFSSQVFNRAVISHSGDDISGAGGYYVDDLQLQKGLIVQSKSYVDSVTIVSGSDYYWKNGIKTLIGSRTNAAGGLQHVVAGYGLTNVNDSTLKADSSLLLTKLGAAAIYQPILVSGTNIKTVNGSSILGSGNLVVSGGSGITKAYAPLVVSTGGDSISIRYNVKKFGAVGDGIHNDGPAIRATIAAADSAGGGTIQFPKGSYYDSDPIDPTCNCQIPIPFRGIGDQKRGHITLLGESKPNMAPVGGGLPISAGLTPDTTGVIIKSSITTFGSAGAAVIGTNTTGGLNHNFLAVENIAIQIKNNFSGGGPAIGGINFANGSSLYCKYVTVYTDTSGYESAQPIHDVTGIEMPDYLAEGYNLLENTLATGFRTGYRIGSHVLILNAGVWCCYYGMRTKIGGSTGVGSRIEAQWCAYDFYVEQNDFTFGNFNLATELIQQGKWFDHIAVLKDSASLADGQIYYQLNTAILAPVIKSGGLKVNMLTHAEGVASSYVGRTVLPTISSNTLTDSKILGGIQATSGLTLQSTTASGNTGSAIHFDVNPAGILTEAMTIINNGNVGIGTTTPASNLEILSATNPTIKLNTTSLTGTPGVVFQKNSTSKWGLFLNSAAANLSAFSLYDFTNGKVKLFADTTGEVGIGGAANTIGTAGIWVDNNLNVFMDNSNFKMNTTTHGLELGAPLRVAQINVPSTSLTLNPSGKVLFGTSGTYDITNNSIGIGTTSPTTSAGFGTITLNGSSGGIFYQTVAGVLAGEIFSTPSQMTFRSGVGYKLSFQTNNSSSDMMNIASGGNVSIGNGNTAGNSTLQVAGSFAKAYRGISALRTLDATDNTIECTSGTFTVTLPTSVGITGREYWITNTGAGTITIGTTSSQTFINVTGTPTTLTVAQFTNYKVVANGANWLAYKIVN